MAATLCSSNCTTTLQVKELYNTDFQTLDTTAFHIQCGRCASLGKTCDHIESLCRVTCGSDDTRERLY